MTNTADSRKINDMTQDYQTAFVEAAHLAKKLHSLHFNHVTNWHLADDLTGLIIQINQMTHGLARTFYRN